MYIYMVPHPELRCYQTQKLWAYPNKRDLSRCYQTQIKAQLVGLEECVCVGGRVYNGGGGGGGGQISLVAVLIVGSDEFKVFQLVFSCTQLL